MASDTIFAFPETFSCSAQVCRFSVVNVSPSWTTIPQQCRASLDPRTLHRQNIRLSFLLTRFSISLWLSPSNKPRVLLCINVSIIVLIYLFYALLLPKSFLYNFPYRSLFFGVGVVRVIRVGRRRSSKQQQRAERGEQGELA